MSIGGLTALTNREYTHYYLDGEERSGVVEPFTSYNLLRMSKTFNDGRQGLGVIGTFVHRDFDGGGLLGNEDTDHDLRDILSDRAVGFGLDGWTFFGPEKDWAMGAWGGLTSVSGSQTRMLGLQESSRHYFQRPDADHVSLDSNLTTLTGWAGRVNLNKENGKFMLNAALGINSPEFESNDMGISSNTDVINKHLVIGYRWTEPKNFYRAARTDLAVASNHDFSGVKTSDLVLWMGWVDFTNYWRFNYMLVYNPQTLSNNALRGGPRVTNPAYFGGNINISSDSRKAINAHLTLDAGRNVEGGYDRSVYSHFNFKIGDRFNLNTGPNYSYRRNLAQYITSVDDAAAVEMYGKRYVVGELHQQTISADIRLDYTFTPWLTLQGYFQPFIAVGAYSHLKEFRQPESFDFLEYGDEGSSISLNSDNEYVIDPTGGDDADAFTVDNPDFNFKALVGTLVLRWEFSPGSTMYFVWTHNGSNYDHPGDLDLSRDLNDLFTSTADDVFALKVSYWFGN